VLKARVHLQEDSGIHSYIMVRSTCIGIAVYPLDWL